MVGRLAME